MADDELIDPVGGLQLLRTYLLHCRHVQRGIRQIARDLHDRADCHDNSKLLTDEFGAFSRINVMAREHPYGSSEYRAGLKQEQSTIDRHYSRNRHHPEWSAEHHAVEGGPKAASMTWLDIIEMVCDWRGAYLAYGSQGTWEESLQKQKARYGLEWFSTEQWWLIDQVSAFVETRVT